MSICRQCFSCEKLPFFCALNSIYSLNNFIGGMFAATGCIYVLESVFVLNVEVLGVNDSLSERIRVFSVGNVA